MPPLPITEFAPAKVNLTLHVTGQRADGYHLLDSLVVFCGIGDRVSVSPAPTLALTITGPQAHLLTGGDDNLVMRAAQLFAPAGMGANIVLDKQLPLASGIGGGSADAAAALRALSRLWNRPLPDAAVILSLGADVPVCLSGRPARMRGVGDQTYPVPGLPGGMALLLVNPGVPLATPAVFNTLAEKDNPAMPVHLPPFAGADDLARWLATQRNDLEWPARKLAPVMDQVLNAIAQQPGALLARMSGSGATCFGLFALAQGAEAATRALSRAHPGWWVQAGPILGAT